MLVLFFEKFFCLILVDNIYMWCILSIFIVEWSFLMLEICFLIFV